MPKSPEAAASRGADTEARGLDGVTLHRAGTRENGGRVSEGTQSAQVCESLGYDKTTDGPGQDSGYDWVEEFHRGQALQVLPSGSEAVLVASRHISYRRLVAQGVHQQTDGDDALYRIGVLSWRHDLI